MGLRRSVVRLVACATVAVAVLTSCDSARDPQIIVPGADPGARAGFIYHDVPAGVPYTMGDLIICLDRPGRAVVERVESIEPFGDLRIDAFAVIPNAMERGEPGFDDDNRTIVEHGLSGPVVVDKACPDFAALPKPDAEPQSVALLLQYSRGGQASAGNRGIVIHYLSGGDKHTLTVALEALLCAPDDASGDCRHANSTATP